MKRLENRVAIVTGGTAGIGEATALRFAREGAQVVVWARNEARGKEMEKKAAAEGLAITFDKVDTSDFEAVTAAAKRGHVNASVLGALQVDEKGDLANWIIPGKKAPGMGGAMDLLTGADKVILAMEHTAKGAPKILKKCTLPLTAKGSVNMIVTEMGVMEITPEGIVLTEINPEFTVEQVQAATEAHLIVSKDLKPMKK